jgi:glycosyltransferase involved in cell wall biosynthesis
MTDKDRLEILFLSSWFPSKAHTTLGNFVQRHAEAIALKHNVTVVYVTRYQSASQPLLIEEEKINHLRIVRVYYKDSAWSSLRAWSAFHAGIEYSFGKAKPKIDLIHMNVLWNAGWQARYMHFRWKIPFIVTEHWTGYNREIRTDVPQWKIMLSALFSRSASVVCPVSKELEGHMIKAGIHGPFQIIPNAVDLSIFKTKDQQSSIFRFLHVSSLDNAHKNIEGILRAWKKVTSSQLPLHLTIGGDGPYEIWRRRAIELEIPERSISFFGEKSWEEIAEMMKASDAFLLFSNYENLPCVIIESLATGLPVISTRVGGIHEVINGERGILIARGDEDALAKSVIDMATSSRKYNHRSISDYAMNQFSYEAIAIKYDAVYRIALNKKTKVKSQQDPHDE